jgi:prepilin-type N-terminal cleavage/methylation domain-containing protein
MPGKRLSTQSGMTLVEVTFAVAVFAIAIAMSATALAAFYAATDVQEQRISAMQANRAVIAAVRQKRLDFQGGNDTYDWAGFINWINQQQTAGWTEFKKVNTASGALPNHRITVQLRALDGDPAVAGDDPIQIHVRSAWSDLRGREAQAELVAAISER